ncbi:MAG: helix-turn-helix domain-containing protein [Chloroflexi bacterium]|nr:helix-turn-helix domain-containing protein [Chloroflexota bacterium]
MTTDVDLDLLTMAEAAKLLKVSAVTVQRWVKQGRLPAYQLGPRYLRIRRSDLAKMLVPTSKEGEEAMPIRRTMTPLTEDEIGQGWQAFKRSEALIDSILARRKGRPLPSSWRSIRQAREESRFHRDQ